MKILLTNDDGHFSNGLTAIRKKLELSNEVFVVAPDEQQSGISQAITFLRPLSVKPLFDKTETPKRQIGFSANGTPADCTKLGLHELCPWSPDFVVSGINAGLNVGINACHSGTVGGAFAAAMFDKLAIAVSLESSSNSNFDAAAEIAMPIIEQVIQSEFPRGTVININVPDSATKNDSATEVVTVPVELNPLGYHFQKGVDPKGQPFFWATNNPPPIKSPFLTDAQAVFDGKVTVSAISYNLNAPESQVVLNDVLASKTG
jgi:5'-nucleotidase